MRVQASIRFSCAITGRNLETELSTETRNLVMFRRGDLPMRCEFCGGQHYWRLIEYRRAVTKHQHRLAQGTLHAAELPAARGVALRAGRPVLGDTMPHSRSRSSASS
jgi:hypothetical protein